MRPSSDVAVPPLKKPLYPALSVGPVYERQGGKAIKAGVLVIGEGVVAPGLFWDLLQRLARRADWIRGTFALATRPACFGVVRSDGALPVTGFCGRWDTAPRLTLIIAGNDVPEGELEAAVATCLSVTDACDQDDPFPHWEPGDPWLPLFWEQAC